MRKRLPTSASRSAWAGFTVLELLTVVAIVGILSTLSLSALSKARSQARQVVCRGNLRQVAYAVDMYQEDARRRPRTLSRLTARPTWLANVRALACPDDPGLRASAAGPMPEASMLWGNRANPSQEPRRFLDAKSPEAGTWEAEFRDTTETNRFSYLHVFGWQRAAFTRLGAGYQVGNLVCQLHGLRLMAGSGDASYRDYEGWTLRGQRDGSVVSRKVFRARDPKDTAGVSRAGGETLTIPMDRDDYPWEFYLDAPPAP